MERDGMCLEMSEEVEPINKVLLKCEGYMAFQIMLP